MHLRLLTLEVVIRAGFKVLQGDLCSLVVESQTFTLTPEHCSRRHAHKSAWKQAASVFKGQKAEGEERFGEA